ncbi:fumarate hydratase C-terminal domain-containing protein, partial [Clostridioides sp. ZZV14-6150]
RRDYGDSLWRIGKTYFSMQNSMKQEPCDFSHGRFRIGKGKRSEEVIQGMEKYGAVYLAAIGGAGAYISNSIKSCEIIAYEDLGAEAIRKIVVEDLKLTVAIDSYGNNIYEQGRAIYECK